MSLADLRPGESAVIREVGGQRAFRRRLLELGFLPGTTVTLLRVAPLRDPIELLVRGGSLSIRRAEASCIDVAPCGVSGEHEAAPAEPELRGAE